MRFDMIPYPTMRFQQVYPDEHFLLLYFHNSSSKHTDSRKNIPVFGTYNIDKDPPYNLVQAGSILRNSPQTSIFFFCEILPPDAYFFDIKLVINEVNDLLNSNFQLKVLIICINVMDGH